MFGYSGLIIVRPVLGAEPHLGRRSCCVRTSRRSQSVRTFGPGTFKRFLLVRSHLIPPSCNQGRFFMFSLSPPLPGGSRGRARRVTFIRKPGRGFGPDPEGVISILILLLTLGAAGS